ncbi:hypothetical protein SAMN05518848_103369 [Paenibacillus sp. PDC88]|nr:hypothetical protein SAMN05518848_103369 [Paenibacillus sp. PDC88]
MLSNRIIDDNKRIVDDMDFFYPILAFVYYSYKAVK